jgi:hypothetical protein
VTISDQTAVFLGDVELEDAVASSIFSIIKQTLISAQGTQFQELDEMLEALSKAELEKGK